MQEEQNDSYDIKTLREYFKTSKIYKTTLRGYLVSVLKSFCDEASIHVVTKSGKNGRIIKEDIVRAILIAHENWSNGLNRLPPQNSDGQPADSDSIWASSSPSKRKMDDVTEDLPQKRQKVVTTAVECVDEGEQIVESMMASSSQIVDTIAKNMEVSESMMDVNVEPVFVEVRLMKSPRDWLSQKTANIQLLDNGDLDLGHVKEAFALSGTCRVIDPKRHCVAFLDGCNIVQSGELKHFKKHGSYRVIEELDICV